MQCSASLLPIYANFKQESEMPTSFATPSTLKSFCSHILSFHKGIRFAGIADDRGELVGSAYRKGLQPLLTKEESELSFT